MLLAATRIGNIRAIDRLRSVLPLIVALVLWTAFGLRRRWSQIKELQREIDETEQP